jgi:hypothetical protein
VTRDDADGGFGEARRLQGGHLRYRQLDETTVVESVEWTRTRDQIALVSRTSVAEAILPLDRRLASIVEMVAALANSVRLLEADEGARAAPSSSGVELKPVAPVQTAPARRVAPAATIPLVTSRAIAAPSAAYDALDLVIDGTIDGTRRRRRMAIATTVILTLVFGALFLALGMSYTPS